MSTIAVNTITDASGGYTAKINGATPTVNNTMGVNRIINGDMRIDQRNAGASVTATNLAPYTVDRWQLYSSTTSKFTSQQNAGSVTPPAGFTNYLGIVSSSAYSIAASDIMEVLQKIEGFNVSDLAWGTSNAKTVTLSFWVYSSLTGTFGGAVQNSASNRSYPFSYVINSANTWEQKAITIAGDTTGTWLTTNGVGIQLIFGLGVGSTYSGTAGAWAASALYSTTGATSVVGTNGATFYITGVQLEAGSVATPFERRPYGTELALCQRYYYRLAPNTSYMALGSCSLNVSTTANSTVTQFPVEMRVSPSSLEQTGTAGNYEVRHGGGQTTCSSVPTFGQATPNFSVTVYTVASGLTTGGAGVGRTTTTTAYLGWSAEL